MVAEKELNLAIKPIIMFKNPKGIKNVDLSFDSFVKQIDKLSVADIEGIFSQSSVNAISNLYELVKDDLERFSHRLKSSFSKEKCLVIYSTSADKQEKLKLLNSLEEAKNHIRAIFAVNVLNEGWDVLNLYDIVKLDEAKKATIATTSEAQLIGRGARYYPFTYKQEVFYPNKSNNIFKYLVPT